MLNVIGAIAFVLCWTSLHCCYQDTSTQPLFLTLFCGPGPLQTPPTVTKVRQLVQKVFDSKQNLVKRKGPPAPPGGKRGKVTVVCACVRACVCVCVCVCVCMCCVYVPLVSRTAA